MHALSVRTTGFCSANTSFRDGATLTVKVHGPGGSLLGSGRMRVGQTSATRCSGRAVLGRVPEVDAYRIHVESIRGSVVVTRSRMMAANWDYRLGLSVQ